MAIWLDMLIAKCCVLVVLLYQITGEPDGVCFENKLVNGEKVEEKICCDNYYITSEDSCKECPAGSYGENCIFTCPKPFYGRQCLSQCNCERCHHIYGCQDNLTTSMKTTKDKDLLTVKRTLSTDISTEHGTPDNYDKTDKLPKPTPEGNQHNGNQGQLTIWVYVTVIGVLLFIVGAALCIKIGLAKSICKFLSNIKQTEVEDNLRIIRVQPILEEINDAASEEDVYCEIRESRMIDCVNQARPLTGRFNSNVKPIHKKCSTIRENVYNHLNYNQSLPNLCIGNEYEHAHANNTIVLLTNSENCLTELRGNRKLQSVPELGSSDSYEEVSCSTNYGIIWGNNDHHE